MKRLKNAGDGFYGLRKLFENDERCKSRCVMDYFLETGTGFRYKEKREDICSMDCGCQARSGKNGDGIILSP